MDLLRLVLILFAISILDAGNPPRCLAYFAPIAVSNQSPTQTDQTSPSPEIAQEKPRPEALDTQNEHDGEGKRRRGELVLAPLPVVSPAIGSGIIPVVGYIFRLRKSDTVSPPSTIGMTGMITDNGTRGFAFGGQLFFKQNTYEVTAGYAHGSLHYNLYGVGLIEANQGVKLPLRQTGQVFFAEASRRLFWKFFVGPRFIAGDSVITIKSNPDNAPLIPADVGLSTTLTSLGFLVSRDTRQNHFFPTGGTKFEFTTDFFSEALGSKYTFQRYQTTFDKFFHLSPSQVLAYDFYLCDTGGNPPFYGNCIYGNSNRLRGYTAGRYLDRHMFATQLEYRLSLPKRLGVAGFAGIGEVIPGSKQIFRNRELLPDIGGGPRFVLSPKNHVNLRADFARGRGSWTWSMGVGEAF